MAKRKKNTTSEEEIDHDQSVRGKGEGQRKPAVTYHRWSAPLGNLPEPHSKDRMNLLAKELQVFFECTNESRQKSIGVKCVRVLHNLPTVNTIYVQIEFEKEQLAWSARKRKICRVNEKSIFSHLNISVPSIDLYKPPRI